MYDRDDPGFIDRSSGSGAGRSGSADNAPGSAAVASSGMDREESQT